MTADLIISYDGTPNDDDALALGKLLAQTDPRRTGYVRHSKEFDPRREEVAQHDAEQRLERGATLLEVPVARHVVVGASTGEVLGELAQREGASIIVFGSDYRTPLGRAEPGTSAQRLLDGGPVAIAVAAAGLRANSIARSGPSRFRSPALSTTTRGLLPLRWPRSSARQWWIRARERSI